MAPEAPSEGAARYVQSNPYVSGVDDDAGVRRDRVDILQNILGGGQQRQQFQDFANRYEQGAPYDGISDDETLHHYQQVAPHIPPDVYQQSAHEAFSRMQPQERMQVGRYLQQQVRQQGLNFPDLNRDGIDDRLQDPGFLAQMTGQMHQQQPGLVGQLLGGAMGGGMGGGMMGNALGGMMGGGGMSGGGGGGLLANPLAKAALAGIATQAVRQMMNRR